MTEHTYEQAVGLLLTSMPGAREIAFQAELPEDEGRWRLVCRIVAHRYGVSETGVHLRLQCLARLAPGQPMPSLTEQALHQYEVRGRLPVLTWLELRKRLLPMFTHDLGSLVAVYGPAPTKFGRAVVHLVAELYGLSEVTVRRQLQRDSWLRLATG